MQGAHFGAVIIPFVMIFLGSSDLITSSIKSIGIPWYVILILIILIIVDFILSNIASNKIDVYTQKGIDEQDKWEALERYMKDFSLLKEKEVPDLKIWESFLVYATVFGISEKVIEQLKTVYPEYREMDYSIYPNLYIAMNMDFSRSFNSVSNAMSSSFSSGSGGGGGFSGGGGGGRRPVDGGGGR